MGRAGKRLPARVKRRCEAILKCTADLQEMKPMTYQDLRLPEHNHMSLIHFNADELPNSYMKWKNTNVIMTKTKN